MNTNKRYIGADIGGTFIKLGIVSDGGEVSMRREMPIDRSGKETVMETLMRGIDELMRESGLGAKAFEGIGVSSAGCVDSVNGRISKNGGNVPNWSFTEVTKPLSDRYGIPAAIANDGNCVALAESWTGTARGSRDALCVVIGTGIGGGIISGGRLIEGAHGFGGEIGHFPTHAELITVGSSDQSSHYEKYASARALVNMAEESGKEWPGGREIFAAAKEGDEDACMLLDRWTTEIAAGLAGLVHIFDPEVIIIGGGVSVQQELLIDPIKEKTAAMVMPDFATDMDIRPASLGNNAGMVGAVKYFMDSASERGGSR